MSLIQPGVLGPVPALARYLTFTVKPGADPRRAVMALAESVDGERCVVGFGDSLLRRFDSPLAGVRPFPSFAGAGFEIPSTPAALWCWLRGADRGALVHEARAIERILEASFALERAVDAFCYDTGRDLTGYEDGTENPQGEKALAVAAARGMGDGLDGSTFVAVQQWVHDFKAFDAMSGEQQDNAIGRRKRDNVELKDAPPAAHVKRTAQESFKPEAFVLRRSMPWTDGTRAGLMFVAFGKTLDAFEAQLKRMAGAEDGIADALFTFTRPITGAYFWCPPVRGHRLDISKVF